MRAERRRRCGWSHARQSDSRASRFGLDFDVFSELGCVADVAELYEVTPEGNIGNFIGRCTIGAALGLSTTQQLQMFVN